jgi:hypothetical protein
MQISETPVKKLWYTRPWVFAVFGLGLVFFLFSLGGNSSQSESVAKQVGEIDARIMAENFVRETLKAPSTAKFPNERRTSNKTGENTFVISGVVDSQNSFGAMLRSDYIATLEYSQEEKGWRLLHLSLDGETIYERK